MLLIVGSLLGTVACGIVGDNASDHVKNYRKTRHQSIPSPEDEARYSAEEGIFKHKSGAKTCLALSGGGIRAAAFSTGVMEAMQRALPEGKGRPSQLESLYAISGTSGGSYALSWFYAQHYLADKVSSTGLKFNNDLLFDVGSERGIGNYQDYLENNSHLVRKSDFISQLFIHIFGAMPANVFINELFGLHGTTSSGHYFYDERLGRIFHNGTPISMVDLSDFVVRNQKSSERPLPFFIINATANNSYYPSPQATPLSETQYEFNALAFGSLALNIGSYKEYGPLMLSTVVAASGAAIDSLNVWDEGAMRTMLSAISPDLGIHADNPDVNAAAQWPVGLIPLMYRVMPPWKSGKDGFRIHLSDGGHTENLSVFPLVRRDCEEIIVVDAGHDPNLEFDDYIRLRCALEIDMGAKLSVEKIDARLNHIYKPKDLECTAEKLAHKDFRPLKVADDERSKSLASFLVPGGDNCEITPDATRSGVESVYCGVIETEKKKKIKIQYIKMAMLDKAYIRKSDKASTVNEKLEIQRKIYGDAVADFVKTNQIGPDGCWHCLSSTFEFFEADDCYFPHRPTWDQDFGPAQFKAYRALGCSAQARFTTESTMEYRRTDAGGLCRQ